IRFYSELVVFGTQPCRCRSDRRTCATSCKNQRPSRAASVGAIAPCFAMLEIAKRASHIDPPASSYAIMRRACPYRGENPAPGKDVHGELDPTPGIRERPRPGADFGCAVQPAILLQNGWRTR